MIKATGLVQGVGFRPFVYRVASRLGLAGLVRNTSGGVEIEAEGSLENVDQLLGSLRNDLPPLAHIQNLETTLLAPLGETSFRIVGSEAQAGEVAQISPDVAICHDCLRELFDPADRRFRYPFTNCTNCGPRFTIVEGVPYDRGRTTMRGFSLCDACRREYEGSLDRRFHAEPNACPDCGPTVSLLDRAGRSLAERQQAIETARRLLMSGSILAVKGLGGFHLACDATNAEAVAKLRERKGRPHKPLALMCRDLSVVQAYCRFSEAEAHELQSPAHPILLLARRDETAEGFSAISPAVAPGRSDVGMMLPYTPLHHLLLEAGGPPALVMTSGNRSEEPIVIDNRTAVERLGSIADFFLVHDRPIWNRCDDSVGFVDDGRLVLMRRSRGFVPHPIELPTAVEPMLALGAMYSNAFALADGHRLFFSQHIGDVDNLETLSFLRESLTKLRSWLGIDPKLVVCDLHPDLLTTHLARELAVDGRLFLVQHHHAHLAAALAAANHLGEAQGLVLDGTGWGSDRNIWGCELLVGSASGVSRAGHLLELRLPGGEAAIRRPIRIAAAYLQQLVPAAAEKPLALWERIPRDELSVVRRMVERCFNSPHTTSAGRLFDAVSALLGVRDEISYEGQAAMELEQLAGAAGSAPEYELRLGLSRREGSWVLDPAPVFQGLVAGLEQGVGPARLAHSFHAAFADALADACRRIHEEGGPDTVALCGGVFQNRLLTQMTARRLLQHQLRPLLPGLVPINDAGLALGQVLVAAAAAGRREA